MNPCEAEYQTRLAGPWSDIKDQLPLLFERACRYPRVRVTEFGVRTGESTSAFLAAAEATGGHVSSFDIDVPKVPDWWHELPLWTFTQAASYNRAVTFPACDVLFIDTSHAYDETIYELRHLVPLVAPGGLVLCHDTKLASPPFEPYAVARALGTYRTETGLEWVELGGRYGLGEITIPARSDADLRGPRGG